MAEKNEKGNHFFITAEMENDKVNREESVIDNIEAELNLQQINKQQEKKTEQAQPRISNQYTIKVEGKVE